MFHLIQGDDEYQVAQKRDDIQAAFERKGDASIERYDGKDHTTTLTTLYQAVSTLSFFEPRKIVILDNASEFYEREKSEFKKPHGLKLIEDMLDFPDDILIILTAFEKVIPRNTRFYKLINSKGQITHVKRMWHDPNQGLTGDLLKWIKKEAAERKLNLTDRQLNAIVTRVGSDLRQIATELDKIRIYLDDKPASELDITTIGRLVPASRELIIFNLLDAVAQKKRKRAIGYLADLISSGAKEPYIVTMLHRHLRQLYSWQLLEKMGLSPDERTSELGLTSFTQKKIMSQIRYFPTKTLPQMISALALADQEIKNTSLPGQFILEKLIFRLAR